jgi:uncharacterized damage-inducible protein DinB
MYHTIQEFLDHWKFESNSTLKVLNNLLDSSLNQKVAPNGRSLGFLAWHLVITLGEMGGKAGLKIDGPSKDAPVPPKASEIFSAYEKVCISLANAVQTTWNDGMLKDEIEMYGQKWTREATLHSLIVHQIHHRGQMTILMRQAGLKVPGIYGPSKEEWSQIGIQAPE